MREQERIELKNIFKELNTGNKEVLEELYTKYNKTIYGIAYSMLKNKEDSEDVVQTVFSKLYKIDKEKLPQDKEASWLYTVTKNETLAFIKKKNNTFDIETIYELEDKDNVIEKAIDRENYNNLISKLNDKEKEIVSLKIISNLSFRQIGELLGEKTGTVKWRYYKSVYALKMLLSNLGMFILTFILGVSTLKQTKKIEDNEIKQETTEDKENVGGNLKDETSKGENDVIIEDTIIGDSTIEHNVNYLGYGIMSISSVFLILTIISAIILKKHQPNLRKKSSK